MVLLSGGIDSVAVMYEMHSRGEVVAAVSFDYGSKHNACELPFAAEHAARLKVRHEIVRLDFIAEHFASDLLSTGGAIPKGHYEEDSMKQTVVPFRNGIMLSIAAGFAESLGADSVAIAAHAGDHAIYPDCRAEFMSAMSTALRCGTYAGIELVHPFIILSKAQIVARGAELGVDLARTWSCYAGGENHCGECGTCVERREAFLLAGVPDPTRYLASPELPPRPR